MPAFTVVRFWFHQRTTNRLFIDALLDVGGGAVKNDTRHTLARIPLRWMIRECFQAKTGIIFDARALKHEIGLDMETSGPTLKAPDLPPHTTQSLGKRETPGVGTRVWDTIATPFRSLQSKPSYKIHADRISEGEGQEELNDAISPIDDRLDQWYWKAIQHMPSM